MPVLEFCDPAKPPCPDCRGRGCRWCDQTGVWRDATAESCRSVADLFAAAAAHSSPPDAEQLQGRSDLYADASARLLRG
jgi:hypothetical protein